MSRLVASRCRTALAPVAVVLAWLGGVIAPTSAPAQTSPEKSLAQMKPADGLRATLFASEPMVHNPTSIDVDSRGRVWVAEGQNYRMTHRRDLPRIEGADAIKILSDTDGDGKADKVTVFADNIYPIPMGLAVEERYGPDGNYRGARVYVGNSPDLLVLEDTDGDDKADKRSSLLTGFGGVDSDHGVHGMTLGLDGRLYFTHGDGCCSFESKDNSHNARNFDVTDASGRHVSSSNLANTLRVDRDGRNFEILADRQRNNYETSLNSFGVAFTSDNDDDGNRGCRVIWVMDGGHYGYRTPGSARHWGEDVPGVVPKMVGTGNGSPSGLLMYEGDRLGAGFRNTVFEADAGTRQVNAFPIERHDATYRTKAGVLVRSDDPWFRPVDVAAAPDGTVLVADWYDAAVGGHAFRDQETGRIYRVAPAEGAAPSIAHRPDFASIPGLIALLRSPTVAAQDAARRSLIARGAEPAVRAALFDLDKQGSPTERARALWVRHAIGGDEAAVAALADRDPAIREQAVRILGRDLSQVGTVQFQDLKARRAPAAQAHLAQLAPLADDPDAGVRRELILALRWLPTAEAGAPLAKLIGRWDGQDRWYLEALGLALDDRESSYLLDLLAAGPFGPIRHDLDRDGLDGNVAVPPFFPADRNESYVAAGTPDRPASALSKLIGLLWRLHRPEVVPTLRRIAPALAAPELQQAADDALARVDDRAGAALTAQMALETPDPARRSALARTLARKLAGPWRDARDEAPVMDLIRASLDDPATRVQGIDLAVASFDGRYGPPLMQYAGDEAAPEAVRVAAIEAIAKIRPPKTAEFLDKLVAAAVARSRSDPFAEAAVRALPDVRPSAALLPMIGAANVPLGLRREALRAYCRPKNGGGRRLLELVNSGKLPDDLRSEATALAHNDPDGSVRRDAEAVLPAPKAASGRALPPLRELARRDGDPARGRAVFFRASATAGVACGSCHRVQGEGRWVGPDLSTIGTKYGREELFRSILYPSAAIGYNNKTHVVATADGRTVQGLAVEESADRIVLKTADGRREVIPTKEVEDHKVSEVSLMPEGLPAAMTDREFVDLVAYLATLRQPVSIVGQYQALGPVALAEGSALPTPKVPLPAGAPRGLAWRRVEADAEGRADVAALAGSKAEAAAFLHVPIATPGDLDGRLVVESPTPVTAYLDGQPLAGAEAKAGEPLTLPLRLAAGAHDLTLKVAGGADAGGVVATIVAPQPVEFRAADAGR